MKRKSFNISIGIALLTLALLGRTAAGQTWVAESGPLPASVLDSLSVSVSTEAGVSHVRYQADMPDPVHRLAWAAAPTVAGTEVRGVLQLEYPEGVAAIQVITPVSGELPLGVLAPGDYTLVLAADGQTVRQLPFHVPSGGSPLSERDPSKPYIESIQLNRSEVLVHVTVPAGVSKVTLESRTRFGAGAWVPQAVERVQGAGSLTMRLPKSQKIEVLRIRGDATEPLPASFYEGKADFKGQILATGTNNPGYYYTYDYLKEGVGAPTATRNDSSRTVVESDIWAIRDHTLYFFNQYRGLQIIDLTEPDAPAMRARLDMPAAGEQMYVLDDRYVVLLVRDNSTGAGQVVVVDVSATPTIVSKQPLDGDIQNKETRMVGSALYVCSQAYKEVYVGKEGGRTNDTAWQWGSAVTSFDLADPAHPIKRDTLWHTGYGNVITATDKYLLVAHQETYYIPYVIEIIDISAPDGTMRALGKLQVAGTVADKFKLHVYPSAEGKDILAVISEAWGDSRRRSVLQTFSLADPANPAKLGYLEVGHGEGLYATRFDGDRAYLVTFLRIDPLWIVDMKDPANPKLLGELEVPGWSTFIQPLGDRLVTIGIDNSNNWRTAVSLFDVADPTKPALLAKVPLGDGYSWSEANYDEKAFAVLPDAGLILVPYQGWASNGWASAVQLVDLGKDSLKARGRIDHSMQPRRADVLNDRIVSISGRDLIVVNALDRDQPVATATLELSWTVNRVFLAGDYLVELENASYWAPDSKPNLRVVRRSGVESSLARYDFTNGIPILGACLQENRLYVMQGESGYNSIVYLKDGSIDTTNSSYGSKFELNVFDVSALPQVNLVGQTKATSTDGTYLSSLTPVWPRPGLLVWAGSGGYWGPWMYADLRVGYGSWWGRGGGGGRMIAFDLADPAKPQFRSDLNLQSTNGWWSFSSTYTADGLLYVSHQTSDFIPDVVVPGQTPIEVVKREDGTLVTNAVPTGIWVSRYYLDVVDYSDAANPTVRPPASLPAPLVGVTANGALVYTKGQHWDENYKTDNADYLDVSAYDGVKVSLVDSVQLSVNGGSSMTPVMVTDGTLLVPINYYTGTTNNATIQAWNVTAEGKLTSPWKRGCASTVSSVRLWSNLLAVQMNQTVELYDVANPTDWLRLGQATSAGYIWPDLSNADANAQAGLVLPLGEYGVWAIPATKP